MRSGSLRCRQRRGRAARRRPSVAAIRCHVEAENDAAVVQVPLWAKAAGGVDRPEYNADGGKQQQQSGAVVGEVGEPESQQDTPNHQQVAPGQRGFARMEDCGCHGETYFTAAAGDVGGVCRQQRPVVKAEDDLRSSLELQPLPCGRRWCRGCRCGGSFRPSRAR